MDLRIIVYFILGDTLIYTLLISLWWLLVDTVIFVFCKIYLWKGTGLNHVSSFRRTSKQWWKLNVKRSSMLTSPRIPICETSLYIHTTLSIVIHFTHKILSSLLTIKETCGKQPGKKVNSAVMQKACKILSIKDSSRGVALFEYISCQNKLTQLLISD